MKNKENDIYDSGLIPSKGAVMQDGTYWNCCSSLSPKGSNGQSPLEVSSVTWEGKTVYIARWRVQSA